MTYAFTHSVECPVGREFAWAFWSDVENWARVDPSVDSVKLDGPFVAGARGETRPRGGEMVEWTIAEVSEGRGAVVEINLSGALLKFAWTFEETEGGGARMTQRVTLEGERAGDYAEGMRELERGIPVGMCKLAEAMARASGARH
jgi:uncharacterized protein YndB with AHSA1/START domain